jgi:hypothetical protein
MQAAARDAEAAPVELTEATRSEIPAPELAEAIFAAPPEVVAGPVQSALGWHVLRVGRVVPGATRRFEDVLPLLELQVRNDLAADILYDRANRVDDLLAGGAELDEMPADMGLVGVSGTLDARGMTPDGTGEAPVFTDIKPVGYFAQANDTTFALFVLGSPATLQLAHTGSGRGEVLARSIGRSLHRIPGTTHVSFVQKGSTPWMVMRLDPDTRRIEPLVALPPGTEDVVWADSTTLLTGVGATLMAWTRGAPEWRPVADLDFAHLSDITRLAVSPNGQWLALVANALPRAPGAASTSPAARVVDRVDPASVRRHIDILAAAPQLLGD